jgi:hypothetical protein
MKNILKLLAMNSRPIALVALFSIIGFFCGNALAGALVGIAIIAFAMIFC